MDCNEDFLLMPSGLQAEMPWVEGCGMFNRPSGFPLSLCLSSPAHSHAIIFLYQNFAINYMFEKQRKKTFRRYIFIILGKITFQKQGETGRQENKISERHSIMDQRSDRD